jgi:hypothetical protein
MGQRDILHAVAKALSKQKISYMLTGSLAVSYYGYPRATHDIDFVIEIKRENFKSIIRAIKDLGKEYLFDKDGLFRDGIGMRLRNGIYGFTRYFLIIFWPFFKLAVTTNRMF